MFTRCCLWARAAINDAFPSSAGMAPGRLRTRHAYPRMRLDSQPQRRTREDGGRMGKGDDGQAACCVRGTNVPKDLWRQVAPSELALVGSGARALADDDIGGTTRRIRRVH